MTTHVAAAAAAVSGGRRRALRLNADNTADGWCNLDDLNHTDVFCVPVGGHLLAVDLDLDQSHRDLPRQRTYQQLKTASRQLPRAETASGRAGHRHLLINFGAGWADTPEGRQLVRSLQAAHLDVRHTIRPPGSPHRLGLGFRLLEPADLPQAAALLQPAGDCDRQTLRQINGQLHTPAEPASDIPDAGEDRTLAATQVLPPSMWALLRNGHTTRGLPSPSEGRMALAVWARANRRSPAWLQTVLDDPDNELGRTFRQRPERWQTQEVVRLAAKADRYLTRIPTPDVGVEQLKHAVAVRPWAGQAGATDLAVIEHLLTMAGQCPQLSSHVTVRAALRTVALGAGVHLSTARRSLRRLADAGWVHQDAPPTADGQGTRWRLTLPHQQSLGDLTAPSQGFGGLGQDAGRWAGLGKSTLIVHRELSLSPLSVRQLAARTGTSPAAVRRHLRRLEQHQLAVRSARQWMLGPNSLGHVAHTIGTAGSRQRQQQRYEMFWRQRRTWERRRRPGGRHPVVQHPQATPAEPRPPG